MLANAHRAAAPICGAMPTMTQYSATKLTGASGQDRIAGTPACAQRMLSHNPSKGESSHMHVLCTSESMRPVRTSPDNAANADNAHMPRACMLRANTIGCLLLKTASPNMRCMTVVHAPRMRFGFPLLPVLLLLLYILRTIPAIIRMHP